MAARTVPGLDATEAKTTITELEKVRPVPPHERRRGDRLSHQ